MQIEKLIQPYIKLEKCQTTKDYALAFARSGIPVIPLYTAMSGVCSCGNTECPSAAKHPRTKSWKADKSISPDLIKRWFARDGNLGIVTGGGMVVIDIDEGRDGHESMFELEEKNQPLPPTLTVNTGGGGVHYYYTVDGETGCSVDKLGKGIDVRGEGGYVVGPSSTHRSGKQYHVDEGQPYEMMPAPEWLLTLIRVKPQRQAGPTPDAVIEGGRNTHLISMAGSMRRKGFSEEAMLSALLVENQEKCNPALDEAEVKGIAKSASRYEPEPNDWRAMLKTSKDGSVTKDAGNAALLLSNLKEWAGVMQYDSFEDIIRFAKAPPRGVYSIKAGEPLTDPGITHVQHWLSRRTGASFTETATVQGIVVAAHQNKTHPVRSYLASLKWDGVERLPTWLHDYFNADNCTLYSRIGTWWMIGAVARIIKPGEQVDHMLVLEGPQGLGKSTAARILGGKWHLGSLPDLRNAQSASMLIQGHWIVEAGELDAFKQAGSSRIKDFLTQTVDVYRRPYARTFQRRPRQCSLIGTTNEMAYLSDPTGNRRYWPCRVRKLDKEALERDRDQLWAESVVRYKRGEAWHPGEELGNELRESQEARVMGDVWEEKIGAMLIRRGDTFVTAEDILFGLGLEVAKIERRHQARVSECMSRIGWKPGRKNIGMVRKRGFIAPKTFVGFCLDNENNDD